MVGDGGPGVPVQLIDGANPLSSQYQYLFCFRDAAIARELAIHADEADRGKGRVLHGECTILRICFSLPTVEHPLIIFIIRLISRHPFYVHNYEESSVIHAR